MAPALKKLAAEVKDWSGGVPLIWNEKHLVVEGEIAQAGELVDSGLSLCAAAHWIVCHLREVTSSGFQFLQGEK